MDTESQTPHRKTSFPTAPAFYLAQLALRVLVITFTLAAAVILLTSYQSVTVFGIVMDASYTDSFALRFKFVADTVVCGLSVLSVIPVIYLNRPKSNPRNYFYLLLLDLVGVLVLTSACSAAMAVGYVAKFGQAKTGWMAICDRVEKFCDKAAVSGASSFLGLLFLGVLTVMSAHKLRGHPYLDGI